MKRIWYPILLGVCIAGCNKQLDKLPDNRTVITNVDQVTQLLTSAYPHAVYMSFTEPMSDNAEDKGSAPATADPESYQINSQAYRFEDVTSIKFDSPIAYWDSCYKAIAVANAVINTAEGITKALAQGGIFGFASAAAIGVAGAAQIASILSAQPGSSSVASVNQGSAAQTAAAAPPQQASSLNITIRGSGVLSVDDFAKQLAAGLADGQHPDLARQITVIRAA